MEQIEQTISSLEVAEMVGKRHTDLLRAITVYEKQFAQLNNKLGGDGGKGTERKIALSDYFTPDTYEDASGKTNKCYNITKQGCEFIAHKMTGIKGTEFTVRYIERFHQMQKYIETKAAVTRDTTLERVLDILEQQVERIKRLEQQSEKKSLPTAAKQGNIGSLFVRERVDTLNGMVDRMEDLTGSTHNKVLCYLYLDIQDRAGIDLKQYAKAFDINRQYGSESPLFVIAETDRLYDMAVGMLESAIERRELFG